MKYWDLGEVLQSFPLPPEVLHAPEDDDVFELVIVEVGGAERHHQVPQPDQGGVGVSEKADHNMAIKDSHGGLVTVLHKQMLSGDQ